MLCIGNYSDRGIGNISDGGIGNISDATVLFFCYRDTIDDEKGTISHLKCRLRFRLYQGRNWGCRDVVVDCRF